MEYRFTINSLDELPQVARKVLDTIGQRRLLAFFGKMGVGKTTFIKALCTTLGVNDVVNSPTFSIVNEYEYKAGKIYHFDFYRLKTALEAYDFGIEEYFESNQFCLMEWAENISTILPNETVLITMTEDKNGVRTISFKL